MHIAVEGCCHGELDKIYETIQNLEKRDGIQVDLLLCCGDFQAVRDEADLACMAVPDKYKSMQNFWQYYSGSKKAPYLTIFIGGNHEASNHLQELPYGGWVAPNIYYMGYAGVVNYKGIRIGGISGIFKGHDYNKGRFEKPPYDNSTKRSVYHVRSVDVFRLKMIETGIDIMMSHDWPNGITNFGNTAELLRWKPFFEEDIRRGRLGSPPSMELLTYMRPKHWFSGHLHCKYTASVAHVVPENSKNKNAVTNFLALDKCLPRRAFLQVVTVDAPQDTANSGLSYDAEWLAVLQATNDLVSISRRFVYLPYASDSSAARYKVTCEGVEKAKKRFDGDLTIPKNFVKNVSCLYNPQRHSRHKPIQCRTGTQTTEFCAKLEISDPLMMAIGPDLDESSLNNSSLLYDEGDEMPSTIVSSTSFNADEIDLGDDSDDDAQTKPVSEGIEVTASVSLTEDAVASEKGQPNESKNENSILSSSLFSDDESKVASDGNRSSTRLSLSLPPPVFGATSTPVRQQNLPKPDLDEKQLGGTSPMSISTDSDYNGSPVAKPRKTEPSLAKNALLLSLRGKRLSDTESDLSESSGGNAPSVPRKFKRRNASFYSSQSEEGEMS